MPSSVAAVLLVVLVTHPGPLDRDGGHRDANGLYHRHLAGAPEPAPTSAFTSGGAWTMSWMDRFQFRPPEWAVMGAVLLLALWLAIRLDRWLRFRKFGSPEYRRRERKNLK